VSAPVTVVKVGGHEVDDPAWLERLARTIANRSEPTVLIHGGGKEITMLQQRLGAEPEWRDGLRITTPETMRAVAMVLSGIVNKRIVSALLTAGADAVGISGEDGALLKARFSHGGALGRTGEVEAVRTELLAALMERGIVPVLSPVSRGPDGGSLNVNADEAAAAVAAALGAKELLFVSNVAGVLKDGAVIGGIDLADVETLIAEGTAQGGMAPKLRAAARAAGSAGRVRIGGMEMLEDSGAGTRIGAAASSGTEGTT
jgi:acetylglutamate kinase